MWFGPLTITSVMVGSASRGSSGPKPVTSWIISETSRSRSSRVSAKPPELIARSTRVSIRLLMSSPSLASSNDWNALTTSIWRRTRTSLMSASRGFWRTGSWLGEKPDSPRAWWVAPEPTIGTATRAGGSAGSGAAGAAGGGTYRRRGGVRRYSRIRHGGAGCGRLRRFGRRLGVLLCRSGCVR